MLVLVLLAAVGGRDVAPELQEFPDNGWVDPTGTRYRDWGFGTCG